MCKFMQRVLYQGGMTQGEQDTNGMSLQEQEAAKQRHAQRICKFR